MTKTDSDPSEPKPKLSKAILTARRRRKVLKGLKAEMTVGEIADITGHHRNTISKDIKVIQKKIRENRGKLDDKTDEVVDDAEKTNLIVKDSCMKIIMNPKSQDTVVLGALRRMQESEGSLRTLLQEIGDVRIEPKHLIIDDNEVRAREALAMIKMSRETPPEVDDPDILALMADQDEEPSRHAVPKDPDELLMLDPDEEQDPD